MELRWPYLRIQKNEPPGLSIPSNSLPLQYIIFRPTLSRSIQGCPVYPIAIGVLNKTWPCLCYTSMQEARSP